MTLIGLLLLGAFIWVVVKATNDDKAGQSPMELLFLRQRLEELEHNVRDLAAQVHRLQPGAAPVTATTAPTAPPAAPAPQKAALHCRACWAPMEASDEFCDQCGLALREEPAPKPVTPPAPKPAPEPPVQKPMVWPPAPNVRPPAPIGGGEPKPQPVPRKEPVAANAMYSAAPAKKIAPPIDWESFLGVKLFAWLGGFALFLGMAFFVKYSIDHNLISPWMRIVTGFLVGVGCMVGGLSVRRKDLAVTAQTLCAAGVSVLYADIYAAHTLYSFVAPATAFVLMSLVTGAAFFMSARLDSRFVAILGWLGGFLTPPLLATGVDRPWALFGYVTVLDLGIAALVLEKKWDFLMSLGAAATLAMEAGWTHRFLTSENPLFAMGVYGFFALLYAVAAEANRRRGVALWGSAPGAFVPLASMGFVGNLMNLEALRAAPFVPLTLLAGLLALASYAAVREKNPFVALLGLTGAFVVPLLISVHADRPITLFGYAAVVGVFGAFLAVRQRWGFALGTAAFGTFVLELVWTLCHLSPERGSFALGLYAGFAVFYVAVTEIGGLWREESLALYAPGILMPIATMVLAARLLDWAPMADALPRPLGLLILLTGLAVYAAVRRRDASPALFGAAVAFIVPLVSPALDHHWLLFGYGGVLALLLTATGLSQGWGGMIAEAAVGLVVIVGTWTAQKFEPAQVEFLKVAVTASSVFFLIVREIAERRGLRDALSQGPASLVPLAGMGAVGAMLSTPELATRPGLVLGLLLLLGFQLAYMATHREEARPVYIFGGLLSFFLLALWTTAHLKEDTLLWGLGFYLAFAVVHTVFPFLLQMIRPSQKPFTWGYAAPLLMLVLTAMALVHLASLVIWLAVGLLALLALGAAFLAGSLIASVLSLALVALCFAVGVMNVPPAGDLTALLLLVGVFGVGFFTWGLMMSGAFLSTLKSRFSAGWDVDAEVLAQFPACGALMPFLLLGMMCVRLPLPDPTLAFSVMAVMTVLLLALVPLRGVESLPIVGVLGVLAVQTAWMTTHTGPEAMAIAGRWMTGFYLAFSLFPLLMRRRLKDTVGWISAPLAGLLFFPGLHEVWITLWDKGAIGLLPGAMALPPLLGVGVVADAVPVTDPRRDTLLAWFGGVCLFFVTLVIPLQFDKEVITLGWALEGAALIALYRRVRHDGLKGLGIALLLTSFVRLSLNPAALSYHARTATPVLNWFLYVYGVTAAALFVAAAMLPRDRRTLMETDMPPVLNGLGGILLFLLLNIEIADFFSTGATITFNFSGNLAQDMAYSIGWGVFAIGTLIAGIRSNAKAARYTSLALLIVTIFKVFLHDLWRLGGLFRVGSFIGLAVGLMLVSFLYQRFLSKETNDHAH